ncbi:LCP family protein [Desemzia sp. RIT 804]|uniref:LCP family protein n=1 Tax=Desemzia sp. RIT 804 TaxID=2810209 RepID=UPI001F188267|nr:LCP family protein [Desemzia sp. RIT 804]
MAKKQRESSTRSEYRRNGKRKKTKAQKIILAILIPIMAILLIVAIFAAKLFAEAQSAVEDSYHSIERESEINVDPIEDTVSVLIMGVDDTESRNLGSARTDALIYLTIDPNNHEINMVSIPRDTYTEIINDGDLYRRNKINSAYEVGQEKAVIETVENLLNVPIHYYATFNFDSFLEIIDALGGIEMDVPVTISEQNSDGQMGKIHLEEGYQTLNGEQALALARTRKIDNDVKRGERQQLIIQAIVKKALSMGSIPKLSAAIEAVGSNMRTDLRFTEMLNIAQSGLEGSYTFNSHIFEWTDFTFNGASMVELYPDSVEYISHKLRVALDLEAADERDAEGYEFTSNRIAEYAY